MGLSKKTQAFHVSEAGDLSGFYIRGGASKLWDDKSTWAVRAQHEGNFYGELLRGNGVGSVLDIAAASGFHAISRKQAGFSVSALDALEEFVVLGKENQKTFEVSFPFMVAKWSELKSTMFGGDLFEAVTLVTVTFEDELLAIAENNGFRLKEVYFDHGKTATRADASLIQFVFQVVEPV